MTELEKTLIVIFGVLIISVVLSVVAVVVEDLTKKGK